METDPPVRSRTWADALSKRSRATVASPTSIRMSSTGQLASAGDEQPLGAFDTAEPQAVGAESRLRGARVVTPPL